MAIDSPHDGGRQVYLLDLQETLARLGVMNWTSEECRMDRRALERRGFAQAILKLRTQFGAEKANRLLTLAALQPRARRKFGEGVWMVTEKGIDRPVTVRVAAYKAGLISTPCVVDLCCGVGGDAIQFSDANPGHRSRR